MDSNMFAALKQAQAAGILAGGYSYAPNNWYLRGGDLSAPSFGFKVVDTWEDLMGNLQPGDVVRVGPGFYAEGNLEIETNNVTFIGSGNRGAMGVEADITTDEGITVLADDVTFINLGVAGGDTADYSLQIGAVDVSPARFRAYGCKFENGVIAVRCYGAGDLIFDDCEICWATNGMILRANNNGFVTQLRLKDTLFHNCVTVCLGHHAAAQQVNDLWVKGCDFMKQEDGTAPTDFINLSDNGNTGFFGGNFIANPTNQAAVITIGTGLIWGPNGTEAGWSTARPA